VSTPSVAVVVCAYTTNRWSRLAAAVASIRAQTLPPDELILVIDHNDELFERARTLPATVMANSGRRGLSGARNTGVARVRSEVTAFLDDDAVAEPAWLQRLAEPYTDPAVVGVGGAVRPDWQEGRPAWFPAEFDWVVGCTHNGLPSRLAAVRNPVGANMSFRTAAIRDAGGFAEQLGRVGTLPVGCEETELAIRIVHGRPGARILHQPAAAVDHHVPSSRARWAYFRARCWAEGLSKAEVARLSDPRRALATERRYTLRTLPLGVARGLGDALLRGRPRAVGQSLAIVAGLALTASGYAVGRARSLRHQPIA